MTAEPITVSIDQVRELTYYIGREIIRRPGVEIDEDTPLVSSGLVDSFALIQVFLELQKIINCRIPASKVRAREMDTIRLMFSMAQRMGTPKP
jgi:acyl carrier protein